MVAFNLSNEKSERRRESRELTCEEMVSAELIAVPPVELSRTFVLTKRIFDILFSATVLLLLAPFFGFVAILVKISSRGPVFFSQERVGICGRPFRMWKFRTMIVGAEAQKAALQAKNELAGPAFKMKNDPRVTAVGRFLRKYSIDELPQFLNVFLGHMSVVGPRPPIPAEVRKYKQWQLRRLSVKPGLTCIWQVSGRSRVDFDTWMRMDIRYIEKASPWFDLRLVVKTIRAVLYADGAF